MCEGAMYGSLGDGAGGTNVRRDLSQPHLLTSLLSSGVNQGLLLLDVWKVSVVTYVLGVCQFVHVGGCSFRDTSSLF